MVMELPLVLWDASQYNTTANVRPTPSQRMWPRPQATFESYDFQATTDLVPQA